MLSDLNLIQSHLIKFAIGQGQLALLQHQSQTQKVQNCIVPWLLSRYGVDYKRGGGHVVVMEMTRPGQVSLTW